jgi:DNA-binding NarL/FixJ family response regulator
MGLEVDLRILGYRLKKMEQKIKNIEILIVEDEIILAKDIEQTLIRNGFYAIRIATTYKKAKELVNKNTPELILCDINLRFEKDGIHFIEELNSSKTIPFIFITAYSDTETINRIKKVKPEAYLTKPFTDKQLVTTVLMATSNISDNNNERPTKKEILVLKLLAIGSITKCIAEELNISFHTVESHRKNMLKKYKCKNTTELVYFASTKKWI